GPIVMGNVSIAEADAQAPGDILSCTRTAVTFGHAGRAKLSSGAEVKSDWVRFRLEPGKNYSVTFDVLTHGAAALWPDEKTKRWETTWEGASALDVWSDIPFNETYNVYFLEAIEVAD
ncbi:MAG: hypothetical protein H5T86_11790, partial [Armatimonadetes bacterium]|nr:hypothetical protein [Armatimonadota bacterium]